MEDFIISRYTYLFVSSKKKYLVYNSRRNSFLELPKKLFQTLNSIKENKSQIKNKTFDVGILNTLCDAGIIVKQNDDENYVFERQLDYLRNTYSQDILHLTIAPTTACNFRCSYCFEHNKQNKIINSNTIDNLIEFINGHKNATKLSLTWYGGEPLLALNQISEILSLILKKTNVSLINHGIITNGYLFNEKAISIFKEHPLNSIQITLDGINENHNRQRVLKKKDVVGSFDPIISNIKLILKELNAKLMIRVNIGTDNQDDFSDVWNYFHQNFDMNNKRILIYPGFIKTKDAINNCWSCDTLSDIDRKNFYFNLAKNKNIDVVFFPEKKNRGCIATHLNGYVVGPNGELYKCWYHVGDDSKVFGYLDNNKIINNELFSRYLISGNSLNDENCKKCFFLPICSGGCASDRLKVIYEDGDYNLCTIYKDQKILKSCLETHYEKNNKQQLVT